MAEFTGGRSAALNNDEISLLAMGSVALRRRRLILAMIIGGALVGFAIGLLTPRRYQSSATFIPSGENRSTSTLAAAASQLGIRLPEGDNDSWGPPAYVELATSRMLLEPIAFDTVVIPEEGNRRVAIMDVLEIEEPNRGRAVDQAVRRLRGMITPSEVKALRGVKLAVSTQYPSLSQTIATRLVSGINRFNLETRKTQAAAERQFIEEQAAQAESALRVAEDRLRSFLARNRTMTMSSGAAFERDRLQRDVDLRQELHNSWLRNREEARIREVRDTPVITVVEEPVIAVRPQSRGVILKTVLGAIAGTLIAAAIVLLGLMFSRARRSPAEESQEFFELIEQVRPKFLRRTAP